MEVTAKACKTCKFWFRPPIPDQIREEAAAQGEEAVAKLKLMEEQAPGECRFEPPKVTGMVQSQPPSNALAVPIGRAGPNGAQVAQVPVRLQPITTCPDAGPDHWCGKWRQREA